MHSRYNDLKKRCKRYYMKIYGKTVLLSVVILLLLGSAWYVMKPKEVDESKSPQQAMPQLEEIEKTLQNQTPQNDKNATKKRAESKSQKEPKDPTAQEPKPTEKRKLVLNAYHNYDVESLYAKSVADTQEKKALKQQAKEVQTKEVVAPKEGTHAQSQTDDNAIQKKAKEQAPTEENEQQQLIKEGLIQPKEVSSLAGKIKIYNQRPHYERAYVIAYTYYEQKEYAKAIEWLKKADELQSSQEKVFELYAKSLYRLKRYEEAVAVLTYFLNQRVSDRLEQLKDAIEDQLQKMQDKEVKE
ncbi:MAG: CDC27 family protein [Campylobacterota bacterium]